MNKKYLFLMVSFLVIVSICSIFIIKTERAEVRKSVEQQKEEVLELKDKLEVYADNTDYQKEIKKAVSTYTTAIEEVEKDNYSTTKILKKIQPVCTNDFYKKKVEEFDSIDQNRGGSKSTGGTSANAVFKDCFIKKENDKLYQAVVFLEIVSSQGEKSFSSASVYKLEVVIENGKAYVNDVLGNQVVNAGINGIVELDSE